MEDPKPEISTEDAPVTATTEPETVKHFDDDGEDLPDNFFDDFSNNDFMAGLDIVDDWVDENSTNSSEKSKPETKEKKTEPTRKKSRSPGKYKRKEVRRYRSRSRDRRRKTPERRRSKERTTVTQETKTSEEDSRRDPEKTKRDIQRDKQRCAKDFEQRVLQEQMKVAESGLFPPGTELDVVLENEKKKAEAVPPEESPKKPTEKPKVDRPPRKSPPRRIKRSPRRSPRRRTRSRSPEYRRKRIFVRVERSRSRRRHRSSSLKRRSRSLDEKMRRNDDLRLQLRAKRRDRYIRDLSPVSETRPSRSPSINLSSISKVSARELWLRNRDRYKQRYGRSVSPGSFSSGPEGDSPKCKRSKQDSFIKEIERIAQIDKHVVSSPVSIPEPVPPPPGCLHPYPGQYMNPIGLGVPQYHIPPLMEYPLPMPMTYEMHPQPQMMDSNIYPPRLPELQKNTVQLQQHAVQLQQQRQPIVVNTVTAAPANKEVTKLFEEQKISLSDYLSVSAKPIDPVTPVNLHKKIKVISKCQEVIRILHDETRFSGRFIPKYVPSNAERPQESNTLKWKSPLRKVFPLRFMFTTPSKKSPTQESVKSLLNKLLLVCDIPVAEKSPTKVNPPPPSPKNYIQPVPKPVPPPISFQIKEQKPKPPPIMKHEGAQTEPIKCQICEIRNSRKYTEGETQTVEKKTEDQSTQVTQDDLTKSSVIFAPRGILKNAVQSLSHLTPAQLLALKQDNEWNTFPSQRQIPQTNTNSGGSSNFNSQFSSSSSSGGFGNFGMNYDNPGNSRGMGMGLGNYDSRNNMNMMNDMDMRQDFGDFRGNSGNIFGGHMPPQNPNHNQNMRGASNNRNIFRNVWK